MWGSGARLSTGQRAHLVSVVLTPKEGNMKCSRGHERLMVGCEACKAILYGIYSDTRKQRISLAVRWFGLGFLFCVCVVYAAERFL